jgi:large repetitive protein
MTKRLVFAWAIASAAGLSAAPAAQVRGRITIADKAVAGVTVSAAPYETPFEEERREARGAPEPPAVATATSAADGTFALALPPHGAATALRLTVSGRGVAPARLGRMVDATQGEDVGDVALAKAQPLAGRIVDPKGGPVIGATVRLVPGGPTPGSPTTATTGSSGSFHFDDASENGNTLRVEAPGFVATERSGLRSGPIPRPLSLSIGTPIEGVVLMPDKRTPAARALVRFEGAAPSRWTETRRDGGFRVEGVAGTGSVVADAGPDGRGSAPLSSSSEKVTVVLAPTATVRGRIIDTATGAPIAGVAVTASGRPGAIFGGRSDARGQYAVTGLAPGSYTLSADEPRYVAWSREHVTLAAGQTLGTDIVLERGAALVGHVVDPDGIPVEGARIQVSPNNQGGMEAFMHLVQAKDVVRTGRDGSFKATRLRPGARQSLLVSHDAFESRTLGGIDLAPGATRSVTVTLPRGRSVRGVVKDEDGVPVAAAEVHLMQAMSFSRGGSHMSFVGGPSQRPGLETGPDGTFEIKGLTAGDYRLSVQKRGYTSGTVDPLKVSDVSGQEPIEVLLHTGASISGLVHTKSGVGAAGYRVMANPVGGDAGRPFQSMSEGPTGPDGAFVVEGLLPGQAYKLLVLREGVGTPEEKGQASAPADGVDLVVDGSGRIHGAVADSDGRPVSDFQVSYSAASHGGMRIMFGFGSPAPGTAESPLSVHADDGAFVLDDVPAGQWNVKVLAKGYQPGAAANVTVPEGGTSEDVDVRLARGTTIRGQVVESASGRGVADAQVEAQPAHERSYFFGFNSQANPNAANTDADGRYEIAGLAPGTYSLTATHPDWTEATATVDLKDQPKIVDLHLGKGGKVTGTVVSGGRAVPSASVSLAPTGEFGPTGRSAVTDDAGRFVFERLTAGRYTVSADLRGQSGAPVETVLASEDATQDVTVTLGAGALIRGVVSGLPEDGRGGLTVNASGPSDYFASTRTAPDGTFELAGAPTGVVTLTATSGSFLSGSRSANTQVTIADGQTEATAEIVFEDGFRLEGHVTRGGQPVTDAYVFAAAPGGRWSATGQTDETGSFALDGLKEGTYDISASSRSGGSVDRNIEVKADTTADLEIPSAHLAGTVVEADSGKPLADAVVSSERQGAARRLTTATSDSAGRFAIEGLDPGVYHVTARKPAYQTDVRELTAAEDADVTIELRRGEGIGIDAHDGIYGMPLRSLMVRAVGAQGTAFTGSVELDSAGHGEIPSLAPGTYTLLVASDGYAPASPPPVMVPAALIAVSLTPGGTVVLAVGSETLARPDASGHILKADGSVYLPWVYSSDGVVKLATPNRRIENVTPGHYTFAVDGGARKEFDVAEGGSTTVTLP